MSVDRPPLADNLKNPQDSRLKRKETAMEIIVRHTPALKTPTPCLILGVREGHCRSLLLKELDALLHDALGQALRSGAFHGRLGETLLFLCGRQLPAERVLLVGLGKTGAAASDHLRRAAAEAGRVLQQQRVNACLFDLTDVAPAALDPRQAARAVSEGLLLANYRFDRFRTQKREKLAPLLEQATLLTEDPARQDAIEQGIAQARRICRGVALARDLVNEPGNVKSPAFLACRAEELAAAGKLRCTVLDREALEREGCGALLGVAQGSAREPRLIILEYRGGAPDEAPLALVGKGVVFDSGGISLKPGEKMDEMKMDMAGAAAVLGTLAAAAELQLPVNLIGIVPAVENLPSATAYRPGDVLTSLSGQTIEVLNTDAEGRLILADALSYAARYRPRAVIDLATLTGACIIALGHHASAVLGNREKLVRQLIRAGEQSGERVWQLPLWEPYERQIDSELADVKNTGGRPAGTITAAAFLQRFVPDCPWAHLDIAGTAWQDKDTALCSKGGTGVGVRLLIEFLEGQAAPKQPSR
jgi:leucyl aminopeptidase